MFVLVCLLGGWFAVYLWVLCGLLHRFVLIMWFLYCVYVLSYCLFNLRLFVV